MKLKERVNGYLNSRGVVKENGVLEEKDIDIIANEIVESLLNSSIDGQSISIKGVKNRKGKGKSKIKRKISGFEGKNLMEIAKIEDRMDALENRMKKSARYFKNIDEMSRIPEQAEQNRSEHEQMMLDLQGQIEDLRTAMIRLSNRVKKF